MPNLGPLKGVSVDLTAGTALVTTAETIVATLSGIETTPEGDSVVLEGYLQVLTGTATTAVQLRVRRGGLGGAQVGSTAQQPIAAAVNGQLSIQTVDTPSESASLSYVLTAQQVAATGNGSATEASIQATY